MIIGTTASSSVADDAGPGPNVASSPLMGFGMDAASIDAQTRAGVPPDYATLWIGPWTLANGWGLTDEALDAMVAAGVVPAIHFYYWGDDISPACVEGGCWSTLHGAQKDRARWQLLGAQLTEHLQARMGGRPVVVFVESEFNKGGIAAYEPFDGYLAETMAGLRARYPAARPVLAYGNWDSAHWGVFDRAAAAADMVGLQAMRGSTRDSGDGYSSLYAATLEGAQELQRLFHKPIVLTDVALSSYPEPFYLAMQSYHLEAFFTGLSSLKEAGVEAMIYRSWRDAPDMDPANYYGEAERHWGLAYADAADVLKPAAMVWVNGVTADRAAARSQVAVQGIAGDEGVATAVASDGSVGMVDFGTTSSARTTVKGVTGRRR